jgi:hypothetical protein
MEPEMFYHGTGGIVNGQPVDGFNVIRFLQVGNYCFFLGTHRNFGGTPFYIVENIRLKGNIIKAIVGQTFFQWEPGHLGYLIQRALLLELSQSRFQVQ